MAALLLSVGGIPAWVWAIARITRSGGVWDASAALHGLSGFAAMLGAALFGGSLVLMLRVHWLERICGGLDRLYFAHHVTGASAFFCLLLHPLALGLGDLLTDPSFALARTLPDPRQPAIFAGWLALLGLMLMMLATFRATLPYATWRRLHASSAIAYAFAVGHVLVIGSAVPLARTLLLLWFAAGAAALLYRFLIDRGAAAREYVVERVVHLTDRTSELTLSPVGTPLAFAPGQFIFAAFYDYLDYKGCGEFHPFTVASNPTERSLRIVVKALGDCTTIMQRLRPGVVARVHGPFGAFIAPAAARERPQIWIAGGIGITPFLGMARSLATEGPPIDLYYAVLSESDMICRDELVEITARRPNFHLFTAVAKRGEFLSADRIAAQSGPLPGKEIFLCGPPAMVEDLAGQFRAAGFPESALHAERFDLR